MTDMTKRYSIDGLLGHGVQPFADLDDEMFSALTKGLAGNKAALAVPVVITSDGVLVDGHQRLRALRAEGRKFVTADDVRILDQATTANALEWAVRLNVQRRQLSVEEKADIARRLKAEQGWGQRKIGELFGVSQAAVSQWLTKGAAETPEPPKPRKPRGVVRTAAAVANETNRIAVEVTNPALADWITTNVDEEDRALVQLRWEAVAKAATDIAEALAAGAPRADDGPF